MAPSLACLALMRSTGIACAALPDWKVQLVWHAASYAGNEGSCLVLLPRPHANRWMTHLRPPARQAGARPRSDLAAGQPSTGAVAWIMGATGVHCCSGNRAPMQVLEGTRSLRRTMGCDLDGCWDPALATSAGLQRTDAGMLSLSATFLQYRGPTCRLLHAALQYRATKTYWRINLQG